MDTLRSLPDVQGRRFGSVNIGYDRIDQIRAEFSALESLVALLCGCDRDSLTMNKAQRLLSDVQARMLTVTEDDLLKVGDCTPIDLMAMATVVTERILKKVGS